MQFKEEILGRGRKGRDILQIPKTSKTFDRCRVEQLSEAKQCIKNGRALTIKKRQIKNVSA